MGGLINSQDRNVADKIPGLGHLPMVGRIFGNNSGTNNKTEIVMTVTPHILRAPALPDAAVLSVFSGTEDSMRERPLQLDSIGAVRMQSGGTTTASTPARPAAAAPAATPARPATTAAAAAPTPAAATAPAASMAPTPVLSGTGSPAAPAPTGARAMLPYLNSARGVAGLPPVVFPSVATPPPAPDAPVAATPEVKEGQ